MAGEPEGRAARLSLRLARRFPDAPAVAAAFDGAAAAVHGALGDDGLAAWADAGAGVAERAPGAAAAYFAASPALLARLDGEGLVRWAAQGARLAQGTGRSEVLATEWFRQGPALLAAAPAALADRFGALVERLALHAVELGIACAGAAPAAFGSLAGDGGGGGSDPLEAFAALLEGLAPRAPFDVLAALERLPAALGAAAAAERPVLPRIAAAAAPRAGLGAVLASCGALAARPRAEHAELVALAARVAEVDPAVALDALAAAPAVHDRLDAVHVERWVDVGLSLLHDDHAAGVAWFRLESARARQALAALSSRVDLDHVGPVLRLYVKALCGEEVAVQSTVALAGRGLGWTGAGAATDGRVVYLPPFVDTFADRQANFQTFKVAATHQAGRLEFGSYRYRFGRDGAYRPSTVAARAERAEETAAGERPRALTDVQRFLDLFTDRGLAAALFALAEDTRVDARIAREYGGIREWLRRVQAQAGERRPAMGRMTRQQAFVENLLRLSLGRPDRVQWPKELRRFLERAEALLAVVGQPDATVEDAAEVAAALYDVAVSIPAVPPGTEGAAARRAGDAGEGAPAAPEFRGEFRPEVVQAMDALRADPEALTAEELAALLAASADLAGLDVDPAQLAERLLAEAAAEAAQRADEDEDANLGDEDWGPGIEWTDYDEWDHRAADYRAGWCRVGERPAEAGDPAGYEETLRRYHGLVVETRRQFELLRPESFRRIKRLEDGHEIDLDQAIEFHADRLAGAGPLARFYSRRDKHERDIAVALLVDVSGSTGDPIEDPAGEHEPRRIVDLEREATVLTVEALEAIGDAYAVYAFSGYGRRNVEFHVVKDFADPLDDRARARFAALEPRRSTRMGAAIRHATAKVRACDARVRVLMLLSDGRPQDHGYGDGAPAGHAGHAGHGGDAGHDYAVHDTRQALVEARRAGVVPFLVTVDREGHDYLRDMCGDLGYEIVADLAALPRRLPTLYRSLTV